MWIWLLQIATTTEVSIARMSVATTPPFAVRGTLMVSGLHAESRKNIKPLSIVLLTSWNLQCIWFSVQTGFNMPRRSSRLLHRPCPADWAVDRIVSRNAISCYNYSRVSMNALYAFVLSRTSGFPNASSSILYFSRHLRTSGFLNVSSLISFLKLITDQEHPSWLAVPINKPWGSMLNARRHHFESSQIQSNRSCVFAVWLQESGASWVIEYIISDHLDLVKRSRMH